MRVLSPAQEAQLLAAVPDRSPFGRRDQALITFALHTGLRVSELVGLNINQVCASKPDGQKGRTVRQVLDVPYSLGKCKKSRQVPLNAAARQAVVQLLWFNRQRGLSVAPEAPLFQNRKHGRLTVRAVQRLVQGYRQKASLSVAATPHTFRHSMASRIANRGGNLATLRVTLGHAWLRSTQVYLHTSPAEQAAMMDLLVR